MSTETVFRPMRRFKQQLTEEECIGILDGGYRGVLSVIGDGGYPYAIPINYVFFDGNCISTAPGADISWMLYALVTRRASPSWTSPSKSPENGGITSEA